MANGRFFHNHFDKGIRKGCPLCDLDWNKVPQKDVKDMTKEEVAQYLAEALGVPLSQVE